LPFKKTKGIPPFTVPRADGTLEASPDIQGDIPRTATARMMRRRQQQQQEQQQGGQAARGDHDGDGDHTNRQGYRDGRDKDENEDGSNRNARRDGGLTGAYKVGSTTRRPLLQRLRKAFLPTLIGGLIAWWYDAVGILIFRNDSRIKGYVQYNLQTKKNTSCIHLDKTLFYPPKSTSFWKKRVVSISLTDRAKKKTLSPPTPLAFFAFNRNLLTFSLLCLSIMLSIFFYLEFIRPRILKKPTVYVNWEKELLYPVRIATISLILGSIGANIALWPVWHLSTGFVLLAVAIATINVLGIFF
jgi:hypothetical protein